MWAKDSLLSQQAYHFMSLPSCPGLLLTQEGDVQAQALALQVTRLEICVEPCQDSFQEAAAGEREKGGLVERTVKQKSRPAHFVAH